MLAAIAAVHLAGVGTWRQILTRSAEAGGRSRRGVRWWVALLLVGGPLFVLALYPPTAFDETLYHLPMARAFAETGALPFLPELRFPVFPQLAEVLAAGTLLFAPDTATHLVQLLAVVLTAALLIVWGREWRVSEPRPVVGWIAAAIFLGNPLVVYLSGTGYVEPLLALFVTASCHAFWRWRRGGGERYLTVAAAFAGAAASTKYLGLFFVAALGLAACVARPLEGSGGRRLRQAGLFALAAALIMAPWYGRILAWTGNPVFPYLSGLFGENDWTPLRFHSLATAFGGGDQSGAFAENLGRLATLPWDVVARRERVGGLPPLSPAYLLGFPWMLAAAWRHRELRWLLALVVAFVGVFPVLPADVRYLVIVLPVSGLAMAIGIERLAVRGTLVTAALLVLLLLPGWLYAGYRLAIQGPLPTDHASREAFLARRVPLYAAVARINQQLRPGDAVYGLHAEQVRDYVRGAFMGDFYGPHRYAVVTGLLADPRALHAKLQSWGVDFFLVPKGTAWTLSEETARQAGFATLYEDVNARAYALVGRGAGG